jgi:acetaldehyde dehydrogenase
MTRTRVAILGSGNIGTDLMIKVLRHSDNLAMGAMVGIDPTSDGLSRAARLGVPTTAEGVNGLIAMPGFDEIDIVLDATSASAHKANSAALSVHGKRLIDLTPAALGPFVVPAVNLEEHLGSENVNICGLHPQNNALQQTVGFPLRNAAPWRLAGHLRLGGGQTDIEPLRQLVRLQG